VPIHLLAFILYSGYIDDDAVFYGFHMSEMDPISKIAMLGSFYYPTFIFLFELFQYFVSEKRQDIWSLVSF
jgi:hypothetical protein